MKKKIAVLALACTAVLGLTGCDDKPAASSATTTATATTTGTSTGTSTATSTGTSERSSATSTNWRFDTQQTLDVCLNYFGNGNSSGVTYQRATSYQNLDGATYTTGTTLPTWKAFENNLNLKFNDVADYSKQSNANQHTAIYTSPASGTPFVTADGKKVDLYFNSAENMTEAASQNNVIALNDYLEDMPNLYNFFLNNEDVYEQLQNANGDIFVAPYFDGLNAIEKMFILNVEMVEKLLDAEDPQYDEAETITTKYSKFINYGSTEKIQIVDSKTGSATTIDVKATTNIIDTQNALATKNGKTLTNALKAYLVATYGEFVGSGKQYANYSEIFTSASACYNTDELVALMRCVKTNGAYLTGQTDKPIQVLFPRQAGTANRVENIMQFAQVFGISGLTAETDRLYFDKDGKIQDARTNEKAYEAMDKMHTLYEEGLITADYAGGTSLKMSETYFTDGVGFMVYDYSATNVVYNAVDGDGIGTPGSKTTKLTPVLPPVTSWVDDDHTVSNFTRHSDDSRQVKTGGWCIPSVTDNLTAALKLVDYLYSEEGGHLQDFGPAAFRDGEKTVTLVNADGSLNVCPKINPEVFAEITATKLGWNDYYRVYVGSTQGIGHIRNNGLDYQVMNENGKIGVDNIAKAIGAGVMSLTLSYGENGFNKAVPTFWSGVDNATATKNITLITDFWKQQAGNSGVNKVIMSGYAVGELNSYKALFETSNNEYKYTYSQALGLE